MKEKFNVEIVYEDESSFDFDVELEGSCFEITDHLKLIARGTLMASSAVKATVYNDEGFDVCGFMK